MIHLLLLLLGVFMALWGIVICVLFVSFSRKGPKWTWLVTLPGILFIAFVGFDLALPTPRISAMLPHEKQIADGVQWAGCAAVLLLIVLRLYEWRQKKQTRAKAVPLSPQKPETL